MNTFVAELWKNWTGTAPTEIQSELLELCLTLCIDNGPDSPSAAATRAAAADNKIFAQQIVAGLLTLGPVHGNAGSAAAHNWIAAVQNKISPADFIASQQILPGVGHRIYEIDERTEKIYAATTNLLSATPHFNFARAVAAELSTQKYKTIPLNIDGALGALMADIGAPPHLADAIFLVARAGGLVRYALPQ